MDDGERNLPIAMVAAEPLGMAFTVEHKIDALVPNGPAAKAGLSSGDQIVAVRFIPADDKERDAMIGAKINDELFKLNTLNPAKENWVVMHFALQMVSPNTKVELTYVHQGKTESVVLASVPSTEGFVESRGLNFEEWTEVRTATSFGEAWYLGLRETWEKVQEVGRFVQRLFSLKISLMNTAGPIGILTIASREATEGWTRLLIFLLYLSANLAVINMLPIPVLDGGHLMFLTYEGVTRRPPNENIQGWLSVGGLVLLLSLMVFVIGKDFFWLAGF
jgi:regulator of sigma E protease